MARKTDLSFHAWLHRFILLSTLVLDGEEWEKLHLSFYWCAFNYIARQLGMVRNYYQYHFFNILVHPWAGKNSILKIDEYDQTILKSTVEL